MDNKNLRVLGGILYTLLSKKTSFINKKEKTELLKILKWGKDKYGEKEPWVIELNLIVSQQLNGKIKYFLKNLFNLISEKLGTDKIEPIFLFDDLSSNDRANKNKTERVPRVDVYEGKRSEILNMVSELDPVILQKNNKNKIVKRRIYLFFNNTISDEILIFASQCSDCLIMDIEVLRDSGNLSKLKLYRDRFRYVVLYGEKDTILASKITKELTF